MCGANSREIVPIVAVGLFRPILLLVGHPPFPPILARLHPQAHVLCFCKAVPPVAAQVMQRELR